MLETIIKTSISFIVTGALGYLVAQVKNYQKKLKSKEEEMNLIKEGMMTLFQNNLTNTFYAYDTIGDIPDYVYQSWCNSLAIYERFGGDGYIHSLDAKMKQKNFIKTDILKPEDKYEK